MSWVSGEDLISFHIKYLEMWAVKLALYHYESEIVLHCTYFI